jgi:hypothetical protein
MSDGGRERASIGVGVWKSSQKLSVRRSAVRSIAWLDRLRSFLLRLAVKPAKKQPCCRSAEPTGNGCNDRNKPKHHDHTRSGRELAIRSGVERTVDLEERHFANVRPNDEDAQSGRTKSRPARDEEGDDANDRNHRERNQQAESREDHDLTRKRSATADEGEISNHEELSHKIERSRATVSG